VLESIELLSDACRSFEERCVRGIQPNAGRIQEHLESSLMLVTALSPHIGYEKAASIASTAQREGTRLREAAVQSGYLSGEEFDEWVKPEAMTGSRDGGDLGA
jgi:fumarate hydratase class II